MNWESQLDWESLSVAFGMTASRHYIVGYHFFVWTDHQPIFPLYNDITRPAPYRIKKHRNRVLDLQFTMKHFPGSKNPVDFNSRHPAPIDGWNQDTKERMLVDEGRI